ncbi:CitMHS family transporter [Shouchella shacheensis]|uniref:CitMHS family transporter n=1 Tax=Shouchella shacheensis TaxID=1649580 RepID=UPI0007404E46|nr:citrate:proton symporter [Shouchella shacheensis]
MLTIVGLAVIISIVALLMWGKISPIVGMVIIPIIGALAVGSSMEEVSEYFASGIDSVMGVTVMFIFAILFFGVMQDTGLLNPLVSGMIRLTKGNVVAVAVGTAIVGAFAQLDGAGATTFLFTIPALLPLYKKLHMSPYLLMLLICLSAGIMNMVPWGGPTGRVASVFSMDPSDVWQPLIPIQGIGFALLILLAVFLGVREKRRIKKGIESGDMSEMPKENPDAEAAAAVDHSDELLRPKLMWVNLLLFLGVILMLVFSEWDAGLIFMVALGVAFLINYPDVSTQMGRLKHHAPNALSMAAVILAAGVFLGMIRETGMLEAIALDSIAVIPAVAQQYIHIGVGLIGVPLDILTSTDAYYFALLPIVDGIASANGIESMSTAYAMLIGNIIGTFVSPFSPALWLGIGLAGVEMGKHIRYSFFWMWGFSILLVIAGILIGIIQF